MAITMPTNYTQIFPGLGMRFVLSKHKDGTDCHYAEIEYVKKDERPKVAPQCVCGVPCEWEE